MIQMVTGRKGSFNRTPKVSKRTHVPPYALLFNLGVLMLMLAYATRAVMYGEYSGAVIPIVNIMLYSYGLIRFVGILDSIGDMFPSLRRLAIASIDALSRLGRLGAPIFSPLGNRYVAIPGLATVLILATPVPSGSRNPTFPASPAQQSSAYAPAARQPATFAPIVQLASSGSVFTGARHGDSAEPEDTTEDAPSVDSSGGRP